jgi:hypothetical protein
MRRFLRLVLPLLALAACSSSAWAADPPTAKVGHTHSARKTWEQRFTDANVAHKWHLTLQEATAGDPAVAKHFQDIDADHKGYVTEKDIQSWRAMRKAARRLTKQPEDKLRPRSAVQRVYPEIRTTPATHKQVVAALIGLPWFEA